MKMKIKINNANAVTQRMFWSHLPRLSNLLYLWVTCGFCSCLLFVSSSCFEHSFDSFEISFHKSLSNTTDPESDVFTSRDSAMYVWEPLQCSQVFTSVRHEMFGRRRSCQEPLFQEILKHDTWTHDCNSDCNIAYYSLRFLQQTTPFSSINSSYSTKPFYCFFSSSMGLWSTQCSTV